MEVDRYNYDKAWEVSSVDLLLRLYPALKSTSSIAEWIEILSKSTPVSPLTTQILDLRAVTDFEVWHLPGAISKPVNGLATETPSPFLNISVMEHIWPKLLSILSSYSTEPESSIEHKTVALICYDGDTSRVATSILRARGIEAVSLMGGMNGLMEQLGELSPFEKT